MAPEAALGQRQVWRGEGHPQPRRRPVADDSEHKGIFSTCKAPGRVLTMSQPNVIPLANDSSSATGMLELGAELQQPQPADLAGRFYSAADYHALYRSGQATPLQVVEALLPLIRRDMQSQSKYAVAWTQTNVDEVLAAARASTARWAAGTPLGILDGVPFGVKDDVDVKGFVSTMGMKVDKAHEYFNKPATKTAWPARRLEEAGAIMMGKMNQHEVGMGGFSVLFLWCKSPCADS